MNVVVIGGGAAGMIAAIESAKLNNKVIICEKTASLGNKLKITGKGRCNLTFDGTIDDFKKNVLKNSKFMYSSFSNFDNNDVIKYFNDLGIETKIERGGRIFPVCDDAKQVVYALEKEIKRQNIEVKYNASVSDLILKEDKIEGVKLSTGEIIKCDKCIVATGGMSYKGTGSTGDGYNLAKKVGHNIVDVKPGLVALSSNDDICKDLQGLSLRNVGFKILDIEENKTLYDDFGELLFAHFGLTGPVALSSSSIINRVDGINEKIKQNKIFAYIDLKPALSEEVLDKRLCRDFEKYANKEYKNSLGELLPQKLISVIIEKSKIDPNKKVHQITKEERKRIVRILKNLSVKIIGFESFNTAIITCGGIDVKEINPKTMESKKVSGLYFAGEVLDIDAYTGGYNLQIAFSTGVASAKN